MAGASTAGSLATSESDIGSGSGGADSSTTGGSVGILDSMTESLYWVGATLSAGTIIIGSDDEMTTPHPHGQQCTTGMGAGQQSTTGMGAGQH